MGKLENELLARALVAREQLDKALDLAQRTHKPLPTVLVEQGFVSEPVLLGILAEQHGLKFVILKDQSIPERAVKSVPPKLAAYYTIMPVQFEAGVLTIAVSNPFDMSPVEDIQTNLGHQVERVLACREDILEGLRKYYGVGADTVERILAGADRPEEDAKEESHDIGRMAEDASVVRLVNQLFHEAIKDRATDIHFEVYRDGIVVRRRIDGILFDTTVPKNIRLLYPAIVSRIKLMSGLNIVERRLPQEGRSRVKDIVVRILPAAMLFDLPQLGLSEVHRRALEEFIAKPHGIIFVTGPTGSGKSTTLYACLNRLNTRDRKIITIEDPVEYELRGITQTQIKPAIGLTFARALRSMLRHDPDVMMVGEVRDRETADIAIQTAMTGHLVLSTLHTNDAAGGAVRLIDMGIDPYLITSTVLLFTAQRLVRVICRECRESRQVDGQTVYRGKGCRECNHSGYRGRLAISEFLPLTPEIQDLILRKSSAKLIREKADTLGMAALAADGLDKISHGITTIEEVLRVTTL